MSFDDADNVNAGLDGNRQVKNNAITDGKRTQASTQIFSLTSHERMQCELMELCIDPAEAFFCH